MKTNSVDAIQAEILAEGRKISACNVEGNNYQRLLHDLAKKQPAALAAFLERETGIRVLFASDGSIFGYRQEIFDQPDTNLDRFIDVMAKRRISKCREQSR